MLGVDFNNFLSVNRLESIVYNLFPLAVFIGFDYSEPLNPSKSLSQSQCQGDGR